jgi:hypothetical protein
MPRFGCGVVSAYAIQDALPLNCASVLYKRKHKSDGKTFFGSLKGKDLNIVYV